MPLSARNVTFRQLQVFSTVAKHGSFTRAAEELHLTQPAVSMQVKQLEQAAGMPLFEQVRRAIVLTEAGKKLLAYANAAAELLRDANDTLSALKGKNTGTLKLSAVSTAKYFAPALLSPFRRQHPGITIKFSVGNRDEMVRQLADNDTDLVIMGRPPHEVETIADAISPHPLAFVAAPAHPLARAKRIPLKRIAEEPLLIREPGSGTRAAMEQVFRERNVSLRPEMEMSSNETIKQAVIAGMGLAFISLHTAGLELRTRKLVVLDVVGLPIVRQWYVMHRHDKRLSPAAGAFRSFVLREAAAIIDKSIALPAALRRGASASRPA